MKETDHRRYRTLEDREELVYKSAEPKFEEAGLRVVSREKRRRRIYSARLIEEVAR